MCQNDVHVAHVFELGVCIQDCMQAMCLCVTLLYCLEWPHTLNVLVIVKHVYNACARQCKTCLYSLFGSALFLLADTTFFIFVI